MKQLTKEQALAFAENKLYEDMTDREKAEFQIEQERLCMPFDVFHKAINKTLGRPVFTHEFTSANVDNLKKLLYGEKEFPTFEEILSLIPKEKLMIIGL